MNMERVKAVVYTAACPDGCGQDVEWSATRHDDYEPGFPSIDRIVYEIPPCPVKAAA